MPQLRLGLLAMTITVLSWGGLFQVGKVVLATLDPYYLTVIRYGIASSILLIILMLVEGRHTLAELRRDPRRAWLLFYGTMGFAGFSLLTFEGLRSTSPQQAAVIAGMQPLMMALVLWLIRGMRPAGVTLVCIAVAFAGCVVVVSRGDLASLAGSGNLVGDCLVLAGSLCWVVYTLGAQRFTDWSPLRYTALSCALGTLSIFIFSGIATWLGRAHVPSPAQIGSVFWQMSFLIVMASVVAVLLWNVGVKNLGPQNATLFGNFIPVVVFAIGILEGQTNAAAEYLGAAMVLAALIANNLFARRAMRLSLKKIGAL
jgi:drug/metabolite transporter (DMT)-like permease